MKIPIAGKIQIRNKHLWVSGLSIEISLLDSTFDYHLWPTFKKSLEISTDSPFTLTVKCYRSKSSLTPETRWKQTLLKMEETVSSQIKNISNEDKQEKVLINLF